MSNRRMLHLGIYSSLACVVFGLIYLTVGATSSNISDKRASAPLEIRLQLSSDSTKPIMEVGARVKSPEARANTPSATSGNLPAHADSPTFRKRAEILYQDGKYSEAYALSMYILQTRLEDDYWVEAVPNLLTSASRIGILEPLMAFMVEQTLRESIEYPDEISNIQTSIFVAFLDQLVDLNRIELAQQLIEAVSKATLNEKLLEISASYRNRIARIEKPN